MEQYFVLSRWFDNGSNPGIICYDERECDARHFVEQKRFWLKKKAENYAFSKRDWAFRRGRAIFGELIPSVKIAPGNNILVAQYFGLYEPPFNHIRSYVSIPLKPGEDICNCLGPLRHPLVEGSRFERAFVGVDKTASIVDALRLEDYRESVYDTMLADEI